MKIDPTQEIRKHYIDLLSGLTVGSKAVPVYNLAQVAQKPPYVLIFGGTSEDANTKGGFSDTVTVNVQVHTSFEGDYGGEKFADDVIIEIIDRRFQDGAVYGSTDNFDIVTCRYSIAETARIQTNTSVHILKTIQFTHFVSQKK
jgi:hypothetical protein